MKLNRKALERLSVVLIPILLVAFLATGWYLLFGKKSKKNNESPLPISSSEISSSDASSSETSSDESSQSEASSSEQPPASSVAQPSSAPAPSAASSAVPSADVPSVPAATVPQGYFSDSLFIGDSRTEGLRMYGSPAGNPIMTGATFFSKTSMSIKSAQTVTVNVQTIGSAPAAAASRLSDVLASRQFGRIYIMLGINEIGSNLDNNAAKFSELINVIRAAQPSAKIMIEANLHVSAAKSSVPGTVFNNPRIDEYNNRLAALADGQSIFYLNVNPIFDDGAGNLRAECTNDGVHIFAKYYVDWANWLAQN